MVITFMNKMFENNSFNYIYFFYFSSFNMQNFQAREETEPLPYIFSPFYEKEVVLYPCSEQTQSHITQLAG